MATAFSAPPSADRVCVLTDEKLPAAGVTPPITTPSRVPPVAASALVPRPRKNPAAGVVVPIGVPSMVPPAIVGCCRVRYLAVPLLVLT